MRAVQERDGGVRHHLHGGATVPGAVLRLLSLTPSGACRHVIADQCMSFSCAPQQPTLQAVARHCARDITGWPSVCVILPVNVPGDLVTTFAT